ncbi:MAG: methionine synthase [Chloroflexi bacterium]|nr:methionine synthase [Chloroflexota bacterium]
MASRNLLMTAVGSYPKPDYILKARAEVARGTMSSAELQGLEQKATEEWIRFQEEVGLDILVDGEMYRGDMAAYFAENLEGFELGGAVRSYGNRYYQKPIAIGAIRRPNPITVEWWQYAQSLTDRPVKGMLTGPYTIADWSFDEHYGNREDFVMALAEVIHDEAMDLQSAGAQYIQIDEPAISVRPEEFEIARRAFEVVTKGLTATTFTHICYGDFAAIYPAMLKLAVDNIDLEMANSGYDLLERFKKDPYTKQLSMGVVDVHSHILESVDEIKAGINRGLELIPADRLFIDPDCGLKTRTVQEAKDKLRVIAQAVREVKRERGLE